MTITERTYSSHEVARMVGVSYRQLDYWIRVGTIDMPDGMPGSGRQRVWTPDDVARLRVIVAARNKALETMEAFFSGALWKDAS